MSTEKVSELIDEMIRVTRVTPSIVGSNEVVRKKLLSMRTQVEKKHRLSSPANAVLCRGVEPLAMINGDRPSTVGRCSCGSSEFWLPIKTLIPKCQVCLPPPSDHMHAMDVVADDHGGWWQVVLSGEMESLVKLDRNFKPVYEFR